MDLQNKVAVFGNTDKKLGHIFFYTMPEFLISKEKLEEIFQEAGLEQNLFPLPVRAVDAYRRATTESEVYGIPFGNCFINYLIREVACDEDAVLRQVVEEVVDSQKKRLEFTPGVCQFILNKRTQELEIEYQRLFQPRPTNTQAVETLIDEVKSRYQQYLTHFTSRAVRNVVIALLREMRPTAIRPTGGVYFVHDQYTEKLETLVKFIRLLKNGAEAWTIPLVDGEDMRALITIKFREQTRTVLSQLAEVLKKQSPTPYEVQQSLGKAKETLEAIREYENNLKTSMEDLDFECQYIQKQMLVLLNKITEQIA